MLVQTLDPAADDQRLIPVVLKPCDLPRRIRMLVYLDFSGSVTDQNWGRLLDSILPETARLSLSQGPLHRQVEILTRDYAQSPSPEMMILVRGEAVRFAEQERDHFRTGLAELLKTTPDEIDILKIGGGSTRLIVRMPLPAAKQLLELYLVQSTVLRDLNIYHIALAQQPTRRDEDQEKESGLTLEKLWKENGFEPNPEQEEAIRHVDGPLYLTAGPGSGKTRVLLWRTLNLIVFHKVSPDAIFLSTFTEKAAKQLRDGLRAMLGGVTNITGLPYDISNMYVGTVHSLCRRLLTDRNLSPNRQRVRAPILLDELAQYLYLYKRKRWTELTSSVGLYDNAYERITSYLGERPSKSKHPAVSACITFFNRLSEECIDPQVAKELTDDPQLKILLDLYQKYLESLNSEGRNGATDFALLQQKALYRLQQNGNSKPVFQHVIIDEYQDTNTVQERLYFELARASTNLCVVGDDDQALYRFRGSTVENFVQFPRRCARELGITPWIIPLVKNYRSRKTIVEFYNQFMHSWDWGDGSTETNIHVPYRVDKDIEPVRKDSIPAVFSGSRGKPEIVCAEIAQTVRRLIDEKKVQDPNEIAFLFPTLKSKAVSAMIAALKAQDLKVYAPRAGRFLEVPEAVDMFGVFAQIFGRPLRGDFPGQDYRDFHNWLDRIYQRGRELMESDPPLKQFVLDRKTEIQDALADYNALMVVVRHHNWDLQSLYKIETMKRPLASASGLSERARKTIASTYLDRVVANRLEDVRQGIPGVQPFNLSYIIRRATSLDWGILDLFYRVCGFQNILSMFDLAEHGEDEGPITNLGLLSQYLERFMEEYTPILTADVLTDDRLQQLLFGSYLYALFRRGESEFEDTEDPFPKGRIPFITIHQAKGLEFPIVVLGNPARRDHDVRRIESIVRPLTGRRGEPLERMDGFDVMRMFYVALSRAENLLIIPHYRGQGYSIKEPFASMLGELPKLSELGVSDVPAPKPRDRDLPKNYSFTSDYLFYLRCPRQYMVFGQYGFVESRSTTMFFGSLIHETLEDLHQHLIGQRRQK
jgi:DNA helicase-2/ATP-dependent DNA helicase PcrA